MATNKFAAEAARVKGLLTRKFNSSLRKALAEGFEETVHSTVQDSSNAVVHWMLGAYDGSNASRRVMGKPTFLRGEGKRPPKHPWVGWRGEMRSTLEPGVAIATADQVAAREVKAAVDKYVRGNAPATQFYVFNSFLKIGKYAANAGLVEAAEAGLKRAKAVFEREMNRKGGPRG